MTTYPRTGAHGRPRRNPRRRIRARVAPLVALLAVAVLALVLGFGIATGSDPDRTNDPTTRQPNAAAPALAGQTLDGEQFDLAALRGQVVLVNVFASWCGPCRTELPLLLDTQRRWSAEGLHLVGIDVRDSFDAVRALLDQTQARELLVLPDPTGAIAVAWGVRGVPETFLVDRDGRIVAWAQGPLTRSWLEQRAAPLLNR
jgi:cytochrome c biogenesis protein CcmG, thiol:disulfide interchange protein DsbE